MSRRVVIRSHEYYDSVRLMQVSESVRKLDGVQEAILMMATVNNKKLLDVAGLLTPEITDAAPDDLVLAIVADDDAAADSALEQAEQMLSKGSAGASDYVHRTLDSALQMLPDANVAVISVPGEYAAAEAQRALERDLHVMLFSDNVSVEDEVSLKELAQERGLLLMGPDCGTAIVNGVGLGFANVVRRGNVGMVGASGTGIQEISVLLHQLGCGISHALGTGGRDLKSAVGGTSMLMGIEMLEQDEATRVIVLTSKPPDPQVAQNVLERAARCSKPVIVNFLGGDPRSIEAAGLLAASTLEEAALRAAELAGCAQNEGDRAQGESDWQATAEREAEKFASGQVYVRGLYSGGTLCYEAMLIMRETLGDIYSNVPLETRLRLDDAWSSRRHTVVDLGDDEFTVGRAHPMIDPTLRNRRVLQEGRDPSTAVLLLDVVLGYGSHDNPAGSLAEAVSKARTSTQAEGRHLCVIASVCGTEDDPQRRSEQVQILKDAGVLVAPSNAQAARLASAIIGAIGKKTG